MSWLRAMLFPLCLRVRSLWAEAGEQWDDARVPCVWQESLRENIHGLSGMMEHVCGVFDAKKTFGCCCCCSEPVYDVLERFVSGPCIGEASRLGAMEEHGTQVEIKLSDGSVAHFDFCVDCATKLRPEDLRAVWETHVARTDEFARQAGRRENQRRAMVRAAARVFPVGVTRWRRQDREKIGLVPDGLVVDRRRTP